MIRRTLAHIAGTALVVVLAAVLGLLSSCASRPVKLSGGWGPHGEIEVGPEAPPVVVGQPPKGTLVIMAGEGMAATGTFSTAQPVPSHQSNYQNQTPPDFLTKLGDWLAPDPKPDNSQPEKP